MVVRVDRGNRVKIKDIVFNGNEVFKDKKLASKPRIPKRAFYRFWKSSKYIADEFEEDKDGLLDFFKEKGYRDAQIIHDTVVIHDDNTLSLEFDVEEEIATFGDIDFLGNAAYTDFQLSTVLGIKEPYNGVLLKNALLTTPNQTVRITPTFIKTADIYFQISMP